VENLVGRDLTADYGFNGSPFYSLVRHVDPTLYTAFGRGAAWLNLIWQIVAGLALAWFAGQALELTLEERLAAATFVFASWDFAGWLLPGLVFAGLWLPVALALVALRRRRPVAAGLAVAWAGMIKLFPFVLLLPAGVGLIRASSKRWAIRLLVSATLGVVALGSASLLAGRSWSDFFYKIVVQFQSEAYLLNSVSFSQGMLALGHYGTRSFLPTIVAIAALAVVTVLFVRTTDESFVETLPRRCLVLLSACGWLVHTWFNYYWIAPLLLLPLLARRHRVGAFAAAMSLALSFAVGEFGESLIRQPGLHLLKLAPYLLVPVWLVALELRESGLGRTGRRIAVAAVLIGVLAVGGEALRMRSVLRLDAQAGALLDRGQAGEALPLFERLTRIAPLNAMAQMNKGIACAMQGQSGEAGTAFARAVALDPESPQARSNFGRWLISVNRLEAAAVELEAARGLVPYDDRVLYDLARVRLRQGRHEDARGLLSRALELRPDNHAARELLIRARETRAGS
jgi:Tfp pilus assembly protein PilF